MKTNKKLATSTVCKIVVKLFVSVTLLKIKYDDESLFLPRDKILKKKSKR